MWHEQLISECSFRLLDESIPRIKHCIDHLEEEEVWYRPNQNSNAVGHLVLHVCGNAQQYIVAGLGKHHDHRNRRAEFDVQGTHSKADLHLLVDELSSAIRLILENLTADDLTRQYTIQGFQLSGIGVLVHVTEHFSYHTGQATYVVKALKDVDTGYYAGQNLDITT